LSALIIFVLNRTVSVCNWLGRFIILIVIICLNSIVDIVRCLLRSLVLTLLVVFNELYLCLMSMLFPTSSFWWIHFSWWLIFLFNILLNECNTMDSTSRLSLNLKRSSTEQQSDILTIRPQRLASINSISVISKPSVSN